MPDALGILFTGGRGTDLPAPPAIPCMAWAGVFLTLAPETFIDSSVLNLSISMPNAIDAVAAAAVDKNPRKPLVTSAEIAEIQLKPPAIKVRTITYKEACDVFVPIIITSLADPSIPSIFTW